MIKILLYGIFVDDNFGGPSLLHGVEELIKEFNNEYELIYYQSPFPDSISVSDFNLKIYMNPYVKTLNLLLDAIKYKLGLKVKEEEKSTLLHHIKTSDIVVNLFGICFCGNFNRGKYSFIKSIKSVVGKYSLNLIAKMFHVKSVKCTASYGPMKDRRNIVEARFASKYIFDVMLAREKESANQMISGACINKNIPVSPDIANLMRYSTNDGDGRFVGISVSYQIIRQWKSNESYLECVAELIKHIIWKTNLSVILIPNEYTPENEYNDIHVALEIHRLLNCTDRVIVPDVKNMNSTQIKNLIAACDILVASRYHSCVAALSSGVPTLVVGWHYKYSELLHLYGQDKWILSSEDCSKDKLVSYFDDIWTERDKEKQIICEKYKDVHQSLVEAGKIMFTK